mmetsp:Transcript_54364/g.116088  ORF Transcript_54364/g.116088 Transcript_54364/m.116088 type:complete len:402 (-) Transcript_54364:323-1528(-)
MESDSPVEVKTPTMTSHVRFESNDNEKASPGTEKVKLNDLNSDKPSPEADDTCQQETSDSTPVVDPPTEESPCAEEECPVQTVDGDEQPAVVAASEVPEETEAVEIAEHVGPSESSVDEPEEAPEEDSIRNALMSDQRLSSQDCRYLTDFFSSLGISLVADLRDINEFEPVATYCRQALEEYQAETQKKASGGVRAALGRLLKSFNKEEGEKAAEPLTSEKAEEKSVAEKPFGETSSTKISFAPLDSLREEKEEETPEVQLPGEPDATKEQTGSKKVRVRRKSPDQGEMETLSWSSSRASSPRKGMTSCSSSGMQGMASSKSTSSTRGTFGQPSRQGLGRSTGLWQSRETSPGPGTAFRPSPRMMDDVKKPSSSTSARSSFGSARRPDLWKDSQALAKNAM